MKTVFVLLAAGSIALADDKPIVDGTLPDSGGSGIPVVKILSPTKGEAVSAMLAVPPKYAGGILEITGQGGGRGGTLIIHEREFLRSWIKLRAGLLMDSFLKEIR